MSVAWQTVCRALSQNPPYFIDDEKFKDDATFLKLKCPTRQDASNSRLVETSKEDILLMIGDYVTDNKLKFSDTMDQDEFEFAILFWASHHDEDAKTGTKRRTNNKYVCCVDDYLITFIKADVVINVIFNANGQPVTA